MALLEDIKTPNSSQVLVFDIDETVLSNMKEFERMKFGKKPYDARWEREWMVWGHWMSVTDTTPLHRYICAPRRCCVLPIGL